MNNKSIGLFVAVLFSLLSCNKPSPSVIEESSNEVVKTSPAEGTSGPTTYAGDNSQTSLDWAGTYFNTLPCASCEGIETWVTLKQDGTFELKTNYLGLNDAREEIFTGNFSWDKSGGSIQLEGLIGGAPGKYKVGENQIWHLDQDGNQIEGALADRYILKKQ
jgi:uncharacterized lipoprotein NlpE involved in copper resistance